MHHVEAELDNRIVSSSTPGIARDLGRWDILWFCVISRMQGATCTLLVVNASI